jgi:NADP-dependent 3-hydroxy acid dehydrogenase YdfG
VVDRPAHNPRAVGADSPHAAEFGALSIDGRPKYPIRTTEAKKLKDRVAIVTGGGTGIGKAISPGATRTPEFEEMITALAKRRGISAEEMWRKLKASNSLNRIAEPEEIARAVVFMASDDSSAMTGHNMIVSCGFHLIHPQELHRL